MKLRIQKAGYTASELIHQAFLQRNACIFVEKLDADLYYVSGLNNSCVHGIEAMQDLAASLRGIIRLHEAVIAVWPAVQEPTYSPHAVAMTMLVAGVCAIGVLRMCDEAVQDPTYSPHAVAMTMLVAGVCAIGVLRMCDEAERRLRAWVSHESHNILAHNSSVPTVPLQ